MKILITGGSGFIGTRLIDHLLSLTHQIVIYDKVKSEKYPELSIVGDVRDKEKLFKHLTDVDTIIHLAAEHKDNVQPKSLYYNVNVGGAKNLIDVASELKITNIIFTSSVAVYGLNLDNENENSKKSPFNDYGKSKLQAENIFLDWANENRMRNLVIIRPTVVFGENNRGNVHNLIKQVVSKKFIMVGKGHNRKSLAYVGNLVNFIDCTLQIKSGIHIFNYAEKPDLTTNELFDLILTVLERKMTKFRIPYALGLIGGYLIDFLAVIIHHPFSISSIRIKKFCANSIINTDKLSELDFRPSTTLREALEKTILYEFGSEVIKTEVNNHDCKWQA